MEASKKMAMRVFSHLGFRVDDIPVADGRRADLRVSDDDSVYHVEVKEKLETPAQTTARRACLNRGEIYDQADPLAYNTRIRGVLHDAHKQLDQTPKHDGTFQLIWFHASGVDADLKYRQAFATFYGHVPLVPRGPDRHRQTAECFYFDYSAAFAMPKVEALILTDSGQLQVCLNEFAVRANEFRTTRFYEKFLALDGIIDPVALAAAGKVIAFRSAMPRKNDEEICKALREQTGVDYSAIRLMRHTSSIAVLPLRLEP